MGAKTPNKKLTPNISILSLPKTVVPNRARVALKTAQRKPNSKVNADNHKKFTFSPSYIPVLNIHKMNTQAALPNTRCWDFLSDINRERISFLLTKKHMTKLINPAIA
jgi:hypothetical protein